MMHGSTDIKFTLINFIWRITILNQLQHQAYKQKKGVVTWSCNETLAVRTTSCRCLQQLNSLGWPQPLLTCLSPRPATLKIVHQEHDHLQLPPYTAVQPLTPSEAADTPKTPSHCVEKEIDISSLHLRLERKQSLPSTPSPNEGVMCLNPFGRQMQGY